jgi:hypothetical protein
MKDKPLFTIEQFYKYINQGRLMGGKCKKCGKIHLPPRPLCDKCLSKEFQWIDVPKKGKLLTYTIIHVPPPQFKDIAPYTVGIIQLEDGPKIPGMIRGVSAEQLKVGIELTMRFDRSVLKSKWPQWPRYYFGPAKE